MQNDLTRALNALYHKKSILCKRIAILEVEKLKKEGITSEDIDRLFSLTQIQVWLRDHFVDPGNS